MSERKLLKYTYGPVTDNNERRLKYKYKYELYALYQDTDVITFIKMGRSKCAGHVIRMDQ
jgi:hypothetical protein